MSHTQGLGLPWDALLYVYQHKNMQKAKKEQYYKEKKNVVSTIVLRNSSFKPKGFASPSSSSHS